MLLQLVETGVPRENHSPTVSDFQTLSHNVVRVHLTWTEFELTTLMVIDMYWLHR